MSKLWILTKVLLKTSLSQSEKKGKKGISKIAMLILLVVCFGFSFSIPLGYLFNKLYDPLAALDQQGILLTLAIAGVSLAIFIFGIFMCWQCFISVKMWNFYYHCP